MLALVLVGALSRARVRGQAGFRTVLFLPQVIPLVVVAVIWRMIYAPDGPLNRALEAVGLGALARPWLGDFTWALPAVGFVGTWVMFGPRARAVHGRRAEDPAEPLRRGARRRRRRRCASSSR